MPHQCTNCGRTFPDGSTEMLSGCPGCGGNKFQFRPADAADATGEADTSPGSDGAGGSAGSGAPVDADARSGSSGRGSVDAAADPGSSSASRSGARDSASPRDSEPADRRAAAEDGAQASARSDVVSEDELAAAAEPTDRATEPTADGSQGDDDPAAAGTDPNLDALRQKLNDQFESIRIVSPGKYELNLMELYDREEYIISLREDGRYVIEMPKGWNDR